MEISPTKEVTVVIHDDIDYSNDETKDDNYEDWLEHRAFCFISICFIVILILIFVYLQSNK